MKNLSTKKKVLGLFLLLGVITLGGYFISTQKDSNAAPPYSFTSTNSIYMFTDSRIPDSKAYDIKIVTFDHPDRLMNESYVEIYSPSGKLLKSQYFNGSSR